MKKLTRLLVLLLVAAGFAPLALAKKTGHPALPAKVMQADSVYVDCVCPRALGIAQETASAELQRWGRFQVSGDRRHADLIFLFSGNPYLGDYITRDGPDRRPVEIKSTILTVIDPNTGATLWTDSRQWGSWRVRGATKDLVEELREQMEGQLKKWGLNDILLCGITPVYAGFANLTAAEALAKSAAGSGVVAGTPDHLTLSSPEAPEFCQRAQFVFNAEHRITGFEVIATRADDLNISDVLERADRFDFTGGRYANGDQVFFSARSKDRKLLIQFDAQGHRSVLARVTYFY